VQQKQEQLAVAQNNLAAAKDNLAEMKAGADAVTVKLKQLDVDNAQAAVDLAQKQVASNGLVAPGAGTITVVNIKAGQSVSATAVAMEIVDTSVFALSASVNELDIPLVSVGQAATVTVDALSGRTLSGKVGTIAQSGTSQSGVVSYKVTVLVNAPTGTQLRSGMSASAEVNVQEADHVLTVPSRAISGTTNNPTVTVMANDIQQTKNIVTGMSDDTYTEVKSGLAEGDMIVVAASGVSATRTTTPKATATSTRTSSNQQFPGGGVIVTQIPGGGGVIITGGPPGGFIP
jgi:RND family efflux transporter MFP subunit